jgi:hypothetical protein
VLPSTAKMNDVPLAIGLRLRFCKESVIKGLRLFPRSTWGASIRSHRGARQRGASNGSAKREDKKGRMLSKSSALIRRPLWIITSYQNKWMEVLTIAPDVEGSFLAVFSFEEEAEAFLGLLLDGEENRKGWRSEQKKAGELVSVLLGPCAGVERVALDPLPLPADRAMLPLVSVSRDTFLGYLSEEGRRMAEELALSSS